MIPFTSSTLATAPLPYVFAKASSTYFEDEEEPRHATRGPAKPKYNPSKKIVFQNTGVGAGLITLGFILSTMGMMLFFEGNLLRLGNICIILGIPLLIGPERVRNFFLEKSRMQATLITSLGIALVFTGRPRIGIALEIFGLLNLFGNMLPLLFMLGKQLPIIGDVLRAIEGDTGKNAKKGRFPEF